MPNEVTLEELKAFAGRELAPSEWFVVAQDRIDQFAECTDDHQFIHVDPERMKASPLGGTIAHGFLSLSLISAHGPNNEPVLRDAVMHLNYGLDRVRFIEPVQVGARLRFLTKVLHVEEKSPGRVLVKTLKTLEIEGADGPAMVAECLAMIVTATES